MRRLFDVLVVLPLAIFSLLVISCGGKEASQTSKIAVKMAYVPFSADLPFFVALEKGYFREEGLEVTPIKLQSSSEMMNALLTGQVDAIAPIGFSTIFGVEANSPGRIKICFPGGESEGHVVSHLLVPVDSKVTSVQELKGHRIGTYSGSTQLINLKLFLENVGIRPDTDVTILQVSPDLQVQALASGQFDALFSVEPYTTTAISKGLGKVLMANPRSRIVSPFVSGASVLTSRFIAEQPETSRKILRATLKAYVYIDEHTDEAKKLIPQYTPSDTSVAMAGDVYRIFSADESTIGAVQRLADYYFQYGILDKQIDVGAIFLNVEQLLGEH